MLALALRFGREFAPESASFFQRFGSAVDYNWGAFYRESTGVLRGYEHCDCYRKQSSVIENRYFVDERSRVRLTYLQAFGRGERMIGTWWPGDPDTLRQPHESS